METIHNKTLTGERAAYGSKSAVFLNCTFCDGESPLKECADITVKNCSFGWKYPLWYCNNVTVENTQWLLEGRSGVWYTQNIAISNSKINAPKQFRHCQKLSLENCTMPHAEETLWSCKDVVLRNVEICGDYFGMNCEDVLLENVRIDGNYCFDGAKRVVARNCVFNSKDSFWNCTDVTIWNSVIDGEYLAWNTENITFVNCKIISHQGLCYIKGLKLENCQIFNTDLAFELCSDIDATLTTTVESIKNPINGIIRCKGVGQIILDKTVIDPSKTTIEVKK